MPTLNDIYRERLHGFPDMTEQLLNYINFLARPFYITDGVIYLEADIDYLRTKITIESAWGIFQTHIDSEMVLGGGMEWLNQTIAVRYNEWLNALYVVPEGHHELGEN